MERITASILALVLATGCEAIADDYDVHTGPLDEAVCCDGSLTWDRHVFDQGYEWQVDGGQATFAVTDAAGNATDSYEDLQVPTPGLDTPDATISFDITEQTLPETGPYWVGAGAMARVSFFTNDLGEEDYRAVGAEFGVQRDTYVPGTTAHVILWRVDGRHNASLIGIHAVPLADVTLPGTFTLTVVGDQITASFEHSGTGLPPWSPARPTART